MNQRVNITESQDPPEGRPATKANILRDKIVQLSTMQFIDDAIYADLTHQYRAVQVTERLFAHASAKHFRDTSRRACELALAYADLALATTPVSIF